MSSYDKKTLKQKVLESGFWSFFNYAASQSLRFAGNLLLTRLLFPEAFGLVAIAQTVVTGVCLLTDIGVRNSVIQHQEGDNLLFLNTCWSIQILQGFFIAFVLLALSPLVASYYGHPELVPLLAISSAGILINSFTSTNYISASRNLEIKRVVYCDIFSYFIGLLFMIGAAYLTKSLFSLMWGVVITSIIKVGISHFYIAGIKNQFVIDKTKLKIILHTGLWIFVSTALTFFLGEGSKLLVASKISVKEFALYNISITMAFMLWGAISQIASSALYPALSEIFRKSPENFNSRLLQSRLIILPLGWSTSLLLIFFGEDIINLLYDARYSASGKMLELMGIGLLGSIVAGSYTVALFSMGEIKLNTLLITLELVIQIVGITVGFSMNGTHGLIWGIAISKWISYPVYALAYNYKKFLQLQLDLIVLGLSIIVVFFYIAQSS